MLIAFLNHFWHIIQLCLFIILCFGIGRKVFKRLHIEFGSFLEEFLFTFAIGAMILSILVYIIGILGLINEFTLQVLFYIGLIWIIPQIRYLYYSIINHFPKKINFKLLIQNGNFWLTILILLAIIFVCINLIGALTPEHIGDGLFYHLGELVAYLRQGRIVRLYQPDQFSWMSVMPKLTEMLYLVGITVGKDVLAKLIHFSFGILISLAVYIFTRRFFDYKTAILAAVLIYVNSAIFWLSRTAYIDMATAFYSFMAFYALIIWFGNQRKIWLCLSAILIGAAYGTKQLALIILIPSAFLIIYSWIYHRKKIKEIIFEFFLFLSIIFMVTLPWTLFALYYTHNPFYPSIGLKMQPNEWTDWGRYEILKITQPYSYHEYLFQKVWRLWPLLIYQFVFLLQPVMGIFIFIWIYWKKSDLKFKLITIFGIIYFFGWTLIPIQESRYYLPVMTILIVPASWLWLKNFSISKIILTFSYIFVILILIKQIDSSWLENKRYLAFVLGKVNSQQFLKAEGIEKWWVPDYFYFKGK